MPPCPLAPGRGRRRRRALVGLLLRVGIALKKDRASAIDHHGESYRMTGIHRTLCLCLLLAATAAPSVQAGELAAAETFFTARNSARVIAAHFEAVRLRPQEYRPYLIEIRGTVTGNARRADGATLIIT